MKCDEGYNSESGNGKSCFPIQCSSPGYTGVAGGCSCNTNGFYGVVTYSSGSPIGCIAISCLNFVSGYTGADGSCTCADGYYGSVTYANRKPSGCTPCRDGSWSVSGNGNSCIPITCPSPAYTGADGYCSCSAGYSGNIIYSNKAVSGCTACANGFWSTSGTGTLSLSLSLSLTHIHTHTLSLSLSYTHIHTLSHTHSLHTLSLTLFLSLSLAGTSCFGITCTSPNYSGVAGSCLCSAGYFGTVFYSGSIIVGCSLCPFGYWSSSGNGISCFPISCSTSLSVTGVDGSCICSAGYSGTVAYTNGVIGN